MNRSLTLLVCGIAALGSLFVPTEGTAQVSHPFDVHPALVDGKLVVNKPVYADALDDVDGVIFGENPGFETGPAALEPGDKLGFELVDKLWFWDGMEVATPPDDTTLSISLGPLSATVDPLTPHTDGFNFGTAGASGGLHVHLAFQLDSAAPATGVYGLVFQLTSPAYESSDPFLVALGYFGSTLTLEQYDAGVAALGDLTLNLPGDANLDRQVDLADFGILKAHFGGAGTRSEGDFNHDGSIDLADFGILKQNFGRSAAAVVPEPAAWSLGLGAFLAAGGWTVGRRVCSQFVSRFNA